MSSVCNYLTEDLGIYLKHFSETCFDETTLQDSVIECLKAFNELEQEILEDCPQTSYKVSVLLKECTKKPKTDLIEFPKQYIPDPYRLRKLKLELPLLHGFPKYRETTIGKEVSGINVNRILKEINRTWEEHASTNGDSFAEEHNRWQKLIQKEKISLEHDLENEKISVGASVILRLRENLKPLGIQKLDLDRAFEDNLTGQRKYRHIPAFEISPQPDFAGHRSSSFPDEEGNEGRGTNIFPESQPLTNQQSSWCLKASSVTTRIGITGMVDKGQFCTAPSFEEYDMATTKKAMVKEEEQEEAVGKEEEKESDDDSKLGFACKVERAKRGAAESFSETCKRRKMTDDLNIDPSFPMVKCSPNPNEDLHIHGPDASQTNRMSSEADFDTFFNSSDHDRFDTSVNSIKTGGSHRETNEYSTKEAVQTFMKYSKIEIPMLARLGCQSLQHLYDENALEETLRKSITLLPETQIRQNHWEILFNVAWLDRVFAEFIDDPEESTYDLEIPRSEIVESFQLLWKQPGLRVLDVVEKQSVKVEVDQFSSRAEKEEIKMPSSSPERLSVTSLKHNGAISDSFEHTGCINYLKTDIYNGNDVASYKTIEKRFSPLETSQSREVLEHLPHDTDMTLHYPMEIGHVHVPNLAVASISSLESISPRYLDVRKDSNDQAPSDSKYAQVDFGSSTRESLTAFLDLRGKKFLKSKVDNGHAAAELDWDRIELSQVDATNGTMPSTLDGTKVSEASKMFSRSEVAHTSPQSPEPEPLKRQRTIVVDELLIQSHPSLIRFLEEHGGNMLTMIYRDLGGWGKISPDLIFEAKTCLVITHMQSLSQRPLPGHGRQSELPMVYERLLRLSWEFELVFVIIHCNVRSGNTLQPCEIKAVAEFAGFCSKIAHITADSKSLVVPVWISSHNPNSLTEVCNSWIWKLVHKFAYDSEQLRTHIPASALPVLLIHDETQWETFLRCSGLNAFAAQLILALSRRPTSGECVVLQPCGLYQFVSMSKAERIAKFRDLIGHNAVARISQFLGCSS